MDELLTLGVADLAALVKTKKVTVKTLTQKFLDRIEAVNPALNAVIHLEAEAAMKQAERADLALEGGETPGPLFGVPMTIKDSLDTYDMVTTWGTEGRKDYRPGSDATCVRRLRDAGAILVGKTNTPEFTLSFRTDNRVHGRTNNPYDTHRTPGGSSGGAAAIIAASGIAFDVGTDTGGSIRLPAHYCGIAGIKPTRGLVPCTGNALPASGLLAPLTQPGPMARRVDDLTLLLEIMSGPDNRDPHTVAQPWRSPGDIDVSKLRIAFHTDNGISTPDDATVSTITAVIDQLKADGINAKEARPNGIEMTAFIYSHLFAADNGDMVSMLLEESHTKQATDYVTDIVNNPATGITAGEFAQTINLWHNYQSSMLGFFDDFDVLISPVNAQTAPLHDSVDDFSSFTYTAAYNLTGWPATVVRAGTDANALPIGVQVITRPYREDQSLAVARWIENRLGDFPGPQSEAN